MKCAFLLRAASSGQPCCGRVPRNQGVQVGFGLRQLPGGRLPGDLRRSLTIAESLPERFRSCLAPLWVSSVPSVQLLPALPGEQLKERSEERRVGKECRWRWGRDQ